MMGATPKWGAFGKGGWLWFAAFVAVWCGLRVFWLDADPGVPAIWEYGFNATDEGYYMGAAKDKLLRGVFCDMDCGESFTYGYSSLTHWLAYLGYAAFGLTDWGWRVPFSALYLAAWCMMFCYARRRCGGFQAFLLCAALSSLPVVVAYERTACNDLAIGALAAIAFCLASGAGVWRIFAAAAVVGSITLIKPSVWVLLPVVAAGVVSVRKTRSAWLDIALFAVSALAAIWLWRLAAVLSVMPEAKLHGMSAAEIIRSTTTHNQLPSLFDFDQLFRGFSSFPRDVCFKSLAAAAAFVATAPLAMAARAALSRRWSWRILLFLSVPAYVAGVSVNNSICLHYYHPALMLLPVVFAEIHAAFGEDAPETSQWRPQAVAVAMAAVVAAAAAFFAFAQSVPAPVAAEAFSNVSNLPRKIVWGLDWALVLAAASAMAALVSAVRGLGALKREGAVWFAAAAVGASVAFAGLPGLHLAYRLRQTQEAWLAPMAVSLAASFVFVAIAFALPASGFRRKAVAAFVPVMVVASFLFVPTWRNAAAQLLSPGRHVQREVASEVARIVPENAVVIGERARQVLMGRPHRTATTMPGCDPIPIVEKLLSKDPSTPLYALADSQNAYNLQHFREHAADYRLAPLKEFMMPSFVNGAPAKVYLCRVIPVRKGK